jgi:hypothetical protein
MGSVGLDHFPQRLHILDSSAQVLPHDRREIQHELMVEPVFVQIQDPNERVHIVIVQSADHFHVNHCSVPPAGFHLV